MSTVKQHVVGNHHTLIGILSGLWIYIFLVLVGPFDVAEVSFVNRLTMMSGYPIIFIMAYLSLKPLQNYVLKTGGGSRLKLELIAAGYIFSIMLLPTYMYYTSDFILGEFSFASFLFKMYVPLTFLILSILFVIRLLVVKSIQIQRARKVVIKGDSKYDMINLNFSDLIVVKSADNYIEVHYLENNELKTKLIRHSLKKAKENFPELLQTHRSYLVNPSHFISWDTRNSISLTGFKVPVSRTYRDDVLKLSQSDHK